jgi:hypothetical protein
VILLEVCPDGFKIGKVDNGKKKELGIYSMTSNTCRA